MEIARLLMERGAKANMANKVDIALSLQSFRCLCGVCDVMGGVMCVCDQSDVIF